MKLLKRSLPTLIIAIAIIVAASYLSKAWTKTHNIQNKILVTGLAKRDFMADLITWGASFSRTNLNRKEAYTQVKKDMLLIKKYLLDKGVVEKDITFSSIDVFENNKPIYNSQGNEIGTQFTGYTIVQSVSIESKDIDKIEQVAKEISELLESDIDLNNNDPNYYYTKLSELKLEMLANATQDGYQRAQRIAENAGSTVGNLLQADMGVFQITAQNSSENYSWGGAYNTTSRRKTASITVSMAFEVN